MNYQDIIKNINILLADDDKDYLLMTSAFLKQIGYNVDVATGGVEAVTKVKEKKYQILLLDFFMPDMTGEEVVKEIRNTNQEIIIILQTGFAGQNPPAEMLKKLNIQNYFDKTEGISRLELEIISAVRIVHQQNKIELTNYKNLAIGELLTTIATEIKQTLLSVGASIEASKMLEGDSKIIDINNKSMAELEKIDKILTSLLASTAVDTVATDEEIMIVIDTISKNIAKQNNVIYSSKVALKAKGYMRGNINDAVFIICKLLKELISNSNGNIELVLTDDDSKWYFIINSSENIDFSKIQISTVEKVISVLEKLKLNIDERKITLEILK